MQIVTRDLRIDDLRAEDTPALFAYRNDPGVARFQGWKPAVPADAERFIEVQQQIMPDTPGSWWQRALRLRDSEELIGDLGLHFVDAGVVELGITIAPAHQRHGHAREALEVMLDFIFGGLHKQRVIANVAPGNVACVRLLEGLGMRQVDEAHSSSPGSRGEGVDKLVLELLDHEWLAPADGTGSS